MKTCSALAPGELRAVFLRNVFLDEDPDSRRASKAPLTSGMMIGRGKGRDQFGAGKVARSLTQNAAGPTDILERAPPLAFANAML